MSLIAIFIIITIIIAVSLTKKDLSAFKTENKAHNEQLLQNSGIKIVWASGGAFGTMNVVINDEIGLSLRKTEIQYFSIDRNTTKLNIDVSWNGLYAHYQAGNAQNIERIEIKYKWELTVTVGLPCQFECKVFYKNGSCITLINKSADSSTVAFYQTMKGIR